MLNKIYKIRESIDVYVMGEGDEDVRIQFYRINTREKVTILASKEVQEFLSYLDGENSILIILEKMDAIIDINEVNHLIDFLRKKRIIKEMCGQNILSNDLTKRYSRQINYFEDSVQNADGVSAQAILSNKKVLIIGVGAVGGIIATQLVRAGITKLVLVDYKNLNESHLIRHTYMDRRDINLSKVEVLKKTLRRINSSCDVETYQTKIVPTTDLNGIIDDSINLVINTADEPYIGHITLKLGRYLWFKDISLYVAGGFDAHLMSTGELISRNLTPCADCCANTFKMALSSWKPKYSDSGLSCGQRDISRYQNIVGGAGGLMGQSLYSASHASMNVIDLLLENVNHLDTLNKRGEFLINKNQTTWFEMKSQKGCKYCG